MGETLISWSRKGPWLADPRIGPWAWWQASGSPLLSHLLPLSLLVATVKTLSRTLGRKSKAAPPLGEEGWKASSTPPNDLLVKYIKVWELRARSGYLETPTCHCFLPLFNHLGPPGHAHLADKRVTDFPGAWSSMSAPRCPMS